jgi:hypothetical protein
VRGTCEETLPSDPRQILAKNIDAHHGIWGAPLLLCLSLVVFRRGLMRRRMGRRICLSGIGVYRCSNWCQRVYHSSHACVVRSEERSSRSQVRKARNSRSKVRKACASKAA